MATGAQGKGKNASQLGKERVRAGSQPGAHALPLSLLYPSRPLPFASCGHGLVEAAIGALHVLMPHTFRFEGTGGKGPGERRRGKRGAEIETEGVRERGGARKEGTGWDGERPQPCTAA